MMDVSEAGITLTIKKTKTVTAFAISFVIAVVLCFTDFITGNEISFSIFYLLPITTAVFLSGKTMGIVFSVISAVLWMIADVYAGTTYSAIYIPIWNAATRFGYFIFHTLLLSKLIVLIAEVREIGFKDPLTKAYNWRYFEEASNGIIKNALRKHLKLALVYFDVDNFKGLTIHWGTMSAIRLLY